MIDRYSTPEMRAIFDESATWQRRLEVELAILLGQEQFGIIPAGTHAKISAGAKFDLERIAVIERETRHDIMAFVKCVQEHLGEEGRFLHYGVTSYDVQDTATCMQLRDALTQIMTRVHELSKVVLRRAKEHRRTRQIGRTHGIHAEAITFGFKLLGWADELSRNYDRLGRAKKQIAVGKISGVVGTHANTPPEVEQVICGYLDLMPARHSTQIISRDRHAEVLTTLAILAATLERFATEVRNLQRTEILEVQEYFAEGQKGSSAMPHKRNPWNSETVSGLARVVRGNVIPALENVTTWHERDLANSSVERIILPDSIMLVDWMLWKFTDIIDRLIVYPENMQKNLDKMSGLVCSEQVMMALIESGLSREDAYSLAQRNAALAWTGENFETCVRTDRDINTRLTAEELDHCFDIEYHLRNLDHTFNAFGIED